MHYMSITNNMQYIIVQYLLFFVKYNRYLRSIKLY